MYHVFPWQRLYRLDARKFVIGNVGPIGCIPYQKTINRINKDECVKLPNELAAQYNGKLKDLMAELNENLRGATFVLANVYDLVMDLIINYAKYGEFFFMGHGTQPHKHNQSSTQLHTKKHNNNAPTFTEENFGYSVLFLRFSITWLDWK